MSTLKNFFQGKSILYIGVKFYHYYLELKNKMEYYGAVVEFYAERDTSIKYGIINRLFSSYLDHYQNQYYRSILKKIKGKHFDYLLVIRGFKMPLWFVKAVKASNPNIVAIMYQWDANINSPFLKLDLTYDIVPEFDKVFSFDYKDVEENSSLLRYCPTFYTDEIKNINITMTQQLKYDFFYFGSYLPERYAGLLKFRTFAQENGYTVKVHFFMPFRYYLVERIRGTKLDRKLLKHRIMSRLEYLENFRRTRAIVDVSNWRQTGIAMRVIDALGTGKKILTTNKWIEKESNYDPKQVQIIDISNIELPVSFLNEKVSSSKKDYSIDKWLENIFLS